MHVKTIDSKQFLDRISANALTDLSEINIKLIFR